MARLVVIADPDNALGFQLAGVEVARADDLDAAREQLVSLLDDATVGLIALSVALSERLDDELQRRIEQSLSPVVVLLPTGGPASGIATRREYLATLIRRAIGFHITFAEDASA